MIERGEIDVDEEYWEEGGMEGEEGRDDVR